jgi:hypothetical protein
MTPRVAGLGTELSQGDPVGADPDKWAVPYQTNPKATIPFSHAPSRLASLKVLVLRQANPQTSQ